MLLLNLLGAESLPELVAVLVSEPLFGYALKVALSMEEVGLLPPGCRYFEYLSLQRVIG